MSIDPDAPAGGASPWRQQAVSRSLDGARVRAEKRVQRFLDATTELIVEKGGLDFTVQEVVERSSQSLRSFYQSFDGKQHLLLAAFEEAMFATASHMRDVVGTEGSAIDRLERFVLTLYEWSERDPLAPPPEPHRTTRAMAQFVFEQMSSEPMTVAAATVPLFDILLDLVTEAQSAGAVRSGNSRHLATLILQSTMFCAFSTSVVGDESAHRSRAEEMWEFCSRGVAG